MKCASLPKPRWKRQEQPLVRPDNRAHPSQQSSDPAPTATMAQPTQPERLFSRGERYRTEGNIVVARQYFLRAAQMGLPALPSSLPKRTIPTFRSVSM